MPLRQERLVVEHIDMTRGPRHEHLNHPFRFWRMMQLACEHSDGLRRNTEPLLCEHCGERNAAKSAARAPKEFPARLASTLASVLMVWRSIFEHQSANANSFRFKIKRHAFVIPCSRANSFRCFRSESFGILPSAS